MEAAEADFGEISDYGSSRKLISEKSATMVAAGS